MLMCDECFTLFETRSGLGEYCPIRGCEGNIVFVDDEIDQLIADLNSALKKRYSRLIKTRYTCAGHTPLDCYPYIGFDINVDNDEHFLALSEEFMNIVIPLVSKLNSDIKQIKNIDVQKKYEVYQDVLSCNCEDEYKEYRVFINHLHFQSSNQEDYSLTWKVVNQVKNCFKDFLVDFIIKLNNN